MRTAQFFLMASILAGCPFPFIFSDKHWAEDERCDTVDDLAACDDAYWTCIDDGEAVDACEEVWNDCATGNDDTDDDTLVDCVTEDGVEVNCADLEVRDCESEFVDCLDAGYPADRCEAAFESCLNDNEDVEDTEDVEDSEDVEDTDECADLYDQCIDAGAPPERCQQILDECDNTPEPEPEPEPEPAGDDTCYELHESCLDAGVDPTLCEAALEDCLGNNEEECNELHESCLAAGIDPDLCDLVHMDCLGGEGEVCDDAAEVEPAPSDPCETDDAAE